MTSACGRLTVLPPPPTARVTATLLADPPKLPKVQRSIDPITGLATITGDQCLASPAELYDVGGAIRHQLVALIAEVKANQAAQGQPKGKKGR